MWIYDGERKVLIPISDGALEIKLNNEGGIEVVSDNIRQVVQFPSQEKADIQFNRTVSFLTELRKVVPENL